MTKIAFILWAIDLINGVGFTLLAIGTVAFIVAAITGAISFIEEKDYEDYEKTRLYAKKFAKVAVVCCVIVAAIPSKCTCYTFIAGELLKTPQAKELTDDARQIIDDAKSIIHKYAQEGK